MTQKNESAFDSYLTQVNFNLGRVEDFSELEYINLTFGDNRIRKSRDFFCEVLVNKIMYKTDELESELFQNELNVTAWFEIANSKKIREDFYKVVRNGGAVLNLGDLKFNSNPKDNDEIK